MVNFLRRFIRDREVGGLEVALHSKIAHTQIYDPGDGAFGSMGGEPSIVTVTFTFEVRIAMRRCRPA